MDAKALLNLNFRSPPYTSIYPSLLGCCLGSPWLSFDNSLHDGIHWSSRKAKRLLTFSWRTIPQKLALTSDILNAMCPFISCSIEIRSHNHPIIWTAKIAAHIFLLGCSEQFFRQMSSNLSPTSLYWICSLNPLSKRHQYVALLQKMPETIHFCRASMCYMQARSNHRICPICFYSQLLDFHKGISSVPHSLSESFWTLSLNGYAFLPLILKHMMATVFARGASC